MGSRMARNLQKAGFDLIVHNRTKSKAEALLDNGAKWADSVAEVAQQADLIFTMLSTPEVVREVGLGTDGILENAKPGVLWADCSTINPSVSKDIGEKAQSSGIRFVDCPVAGSKAPAEAGELLFLVGGAETDVDSLQSAFDAMGKKSLHLGPVGSGTGMKMLVNLLLGQAMAAFSEAVSLGKGMGLEQQKVIEVLLNTPVTAPFLSLVRPKMENPADREVNFPLEWMQKDLHLAAVTAWENDVPMPSLNAAKELFAQAKKAGFANRDFSHIFHYLNY